MSYYAFGVDDCFAQAHWIVFDNKDPLILMEDVALCKVNGGNMASTFRRLRDQGRPFYVEAPLVEFGPPRPPDFPRPPARMGGRCHVEVRRYDSWDFDITGIRTSRGDRINVDFRFSYDGEPVVDDRGMISATARRVYMADDLEEALDSLFGPPKPSEPKPKPKLCRWSGVT